MHSTRASYILAAITLLSLAGVIFCEDAVADTPAPELESLTDENAMPIIASKKIYIVLFHKASEKSNADASTALDGKGGNSLREEMIELAKISGGQFGVAEVNVEEFPLVPKMYKISTFPMVKLFRDSKPGDYGGVRHAPSMKSFLETLFNPAFDGFF